MVEKVSEVSMNVAMKEDSMSDDNTLLKHIAKKKKQDEVGMNFFLVAMFPPSVLVPLTPPFEQGKQEIEKQAAKEVATASLGLAGGPRQTKMGHGLRRQVALAVAGQKDTRNRGKNSVIVRKGEAASTLSNSAPVSVSRSEEQSTTPVPITVAKKALLDVITKLHQPCTAQHLQAAAEVNPIIVNTSVPEAESVRQDKPLRTKEDSGEVRPLWQCAKQEKNAIPKQGETAAQSRNSPTTLQQLKAQAGSASGVKGGNEGQTLEVNYKFQRWSGDHSVKISVPTKARREDNVTLLPSDARAADVLLRNMGHLTGLRPDLLKPQQDRDEEQQQRRQQEQHEEDQE